MATVVLPRSLVALFPDATRREVVAGATVGELLFALEARTPGIRARLVDGPRLRPHIKVYVDAEPADLDTPVPAAATVHVIPAVSGGMECVGRERGERVREGTPVGAAPGWTAQGEWGVPVVADGRQPADG